MGFWNWFNNTPEAKNNIPSEFNGTIFYPLQSANVFAGLKHFDDFSEIPELNAVINKRAKEFARAEINVVNDKGEVVHDHWLQKLIKNPNWFQAQDEFLRQTKLFRDIAGNEYIYNLTPVGFTDPNRTSALFTLPPQLINLKYNDKTPFFLLSKAPEVLYTYKQNGADNNLDKDNILHLNDNNVNISEVNNASVLTGESKMNGLKPAIHNLRLAYESRGIILKRRGAMGILSNTAKDAAGSIAIDPKEVDEIQNKYKRYGGLAHQDSLIITSAPLAWQKMEVSPDKLGLFDETSADFDKILDAYDTPSELFVRKAGSTYENQKQARKGFIMDTIWPESLEWCGSLNRKYLLDEDVKLVSNYTHLHLFQEDLKVRGDALGAMVNALSKAVMDGAITIEEYKSELLAKFGLGSTQK